MIPLDSIQVQVCSIRRVYVYLAFRLLFYNYVKSKQFSIYYIKLSTESSSVTHLNAEGRATYTPTGSFNYPGCLYHAADCDDKFTTYYSNATILSALMVDIFF